MFKRLDDGTELTDPNDKQREELRKAEALKKLNANPRAVLSYVIGGVRMEVSLADFMVKYGDPTQYKPEDLIKYVIKTFYKLG